MANSSFTTVYSNSEQQIKPVSDVIVKGDVIVVISSVIQCDTLTIDFHDESTCRQLGLENQAVDFEATFMSPISIG